METFQEIRANHPDQFLVLIDYEQREVAPDQLEILGASGVEAFPDGEAMFRRYRSLKREGKKVIFCPPSYTSEFVIERTFSAHLRG